MPIVRPTCTLHAHSRCFRKKEKSIGEMDLRRIVGQVVNRMFINYNPWRKSATRGRSMKKYWLGSLITGSVSILFGHLRRKIQVSMAFKVLLFGGFRPHLHVNNVLCLWKWWLKLSCCEMDRWSFVGFTTDVECGLIPFYHV